MPEEKTEDQGVPHYGVSRNGAKSDFRRSGAPRHNQSSSHRNQKLGHRNSTKNPMQRRYRTTEQEQSIKYLNPAPTLFASDNMASPAVCIFFRCRRMFGRWKPLVFRKVAVAAASRGIRAGPISRRDSCGLSADSLRDSSGKAAGLLSLLPASAKTRMGMLCVKAGGHNSAFMS
jgi:hypothetical protein